MKTNAARILDQQDIAYELLIYDLDPADLEGEQVAERAAAKLNLAPAQVFKTLVVRGDRHGVCLAVLPAETRLNLKALAKLTGDRKVDTVPLKEVQGLTGYIRGGVTALGGKKAYPVFIDASAQHHDHIAVSAGKRGHMLWLQPLDYIQATQAQVGALAIAPG